MRLSPQTGSARSERLLTSIRRDLEPRSLGRPGILDLPDELLMDIFKHAKGGSDVRNIRLACRRFCSTSSHHFLGCLNVCLTASSLAKAQEISHHPITSRGIRILHISLLSHSFRVAGSEFLLLATTHLREDIKLALEYSVNSQDVILEGKKVSVAAHFVPLWKERKRLLGSW